MRCSTTLKVELTENYGGVTIYGDYSDLDHLYDSINYLIHGEPKNIGEYTMQNHLYGFLYDVRHAYQGQRGMVLVDNYLSDSTREWFNVKKKDVTDKNVCFCFNYLLTDLLLDMILIKYFIYRVDKKENDMYNPHINMVNFFYSIVLDTLTGMLTEAKFYNEEKEKLNCCKKIIMITGSIEERKKQINEALKELDFEPKKLVKKK